MRLIDADDALRKMERVMDMQDSYLPIHFKEWVIDECPTIDAVPRQKYEEDMENAFAHGYTDAESKYRKMIEDGEPVEVVRCKDCKYFVSDMEWCEADDEHPASPDAFCSWAERISDE